MSQEQSSDADAGQSSPAIVREELFKYITPISGGRKLYFYTFGEEKLELPEGAELAQTSEAPHV